MKALRSAMLVLSCLAIGAPTSFAQATPPTSEVVVLVNETPLYDVEIRQIYDSLHRMVAQQGQEVDERELQKAAVDQGVDMKLLVQEAARRGIEVGDGRVDEILAGIEADAGGPEALQQGLEQGGLTLQDLRRGLADKEAIRLFMEREIQGKLEVGDEQVASFYQENLDRFQAPERVRARHILIKPQPAGDDAAKAIAKAQATSAHQRAVDGEDFAALAKELSQGPSAPDGGDLGFFAADQMVEPFSKAAFALEVGGISDVVETEFGFHVIKLEEKRPAGVQTLDEVAGPLRQMLTQKAAAETLENLLSGLRAAAKVVPASPPPTAAEAGASSDS